MAVAGNKQPSHILCLLRLHILGRWLGTATRADSCIEDYLNRLSKGTVLVLVPSCCPWVLLLTKQTKRLHPRILLASEIDNQVPSNTVPTIIRINSPAAFNSLFKAHVSLEYAGTSSAVSISGPFPPYAWLLGLLEHLLPYMTSRAKALTLIPRIEVPNHLGIHRLRALFWFLIPPGDSYGKE